MNEPRHQMTTGRMLLATAWFAVAALLVSSFPARPPWLTAVASHAVFIAICAGVGAMVGRTLAALAKSLALIALFWGVIFVCAILVRLRYR